MFAWDRHAEAWVAAHRAAWLDPVAEGLSYAGDYGAVWLALALVVALARRRLAILVLVVAAAALAEVSTTVLKLLIPRRRPEVQTLIGEPHTHSFPSGHAATSFACATVLGAFVPRARIPLYALAVLVAWSRVYVGVHFPLDVLAGAAWGVLLGLAVLRAPRPRAEGLLRSRRAPRRG